MPATAPTRQSKAASDRFGSRAWARALVTDRGQVTPSGRHTRVEVCEGPADAAARADARRAGRHRLLPCQVFLATGAGSRPLFPAGPFDEFRCAQRQVRPAHELEFLTRLDARDQGTEDYRPFAKFDLRRGGEPLPRLSRVRPFWEQLAARHGLRAIPRPRLREAALREGLITLAPGVSSGVFRRPGQQALPYAEVLDLLRATCSPIEWIAWLETAFPAPPEGTILHRYYLDADLTVHLVRHHWREGKSLRRAQPTADAPGLWLYPARAAG